MIHVFTSSPRAGRTAKLAAALADRLRDGESVMEIRPAGVSRLELDGFGGIRRVDLVAWGRAR